MLVALESKLFSALFLDVSSNVGGEEIVVFEFTCVIESVVIAFMIDWI